MNSLKTLVVFLLLMTISSCEKDPVPQPGTDEFHLYLRSVRNDNKVTLTWEINACPDLCLCIGSKPNPDHFDILMSDSNSSKLELYTTVSNDILGLTIGNLINGNPYYFAIKAVGQNGDNVLSKTIMVIPDYPENTQTLFQTIDESREFGSWSPDELSVVYMGDYFWNNGNNSARSVFIFNLLTKEKWLVEKNSFSPEWSPTEQKIAYHTDYGEVNSSLKYRPNDIAVYNIQNNTIKRLTGGDSYNFRPAWSPDGKWVAFLSNQAGGNEYNIWKAPADSGTAIQITTDFNDLNDLAIMPDRSPRKPSWSKDGKTIAFARLTKTNPGYVLDIYGVSVTNGNKTIIVSSQWDDCCPAYTPDGSTIAFVSNRSGSNEIWSMNLQTKKLKQITGSREQWVIGWGGIEWSSSGKEILFTSNSGLNTLYKVENIENR